MQADPQVMATAPDVYGLRVQITADPVAVRAGLAILVEGMARRGVAADLRETAELVLAEVLNNVVEHGYAGGPGQIDVAVTRVARGLRCRITDAGRPMPGGTLPQGALPQAQGDDLPEGGFGWFLIRAMTEDLRYVRHEGCNVLTFRLPSFPPFRQ